MKTGTTEGETGKTIQAIGNAVKLIEAIEELGSVTVTELANEVDMPRSTVHIYLRTLRQHGYVVEEDGNHRTGLRFLMHGGRARKQVEPYEAAKSEVDRLATKTGEMCDLGVEQNGMRVLLYKSETDRAVYDNVATGEFTHMHWTALGKALLAWSPDDVVERIIDTHGLPEATDATITDRETLRTELDEIVEQGYAIEDEDRREGVASVAVPVIDNDSKQAVAALSVSGPRSRVLDRDVSGLVEEIQQSVNVVELRYNHY